MDPTRARAQSVIKRREITTKTDQVILMTQINKQKTHRFETRPTRPAASQLYK